MVLVCHAACAHGRNSPAISPKVVRLRLPRPLAPLLLALSTLAALAAPGHAATLSVSGQYPTIQAAVTAAAGGDTVLVADGTYRGPGNHDIDFGGKSLTVVSLHGAAKMVIDCGGVWKAAAIATGLDNVTHLLWTNPDGRATLWFVNPDASYSLTGAYGPYVDGGGVWRAGALSVGPDNVAHILWTNPDGRSTLWYINPDGSYGPYVNRGGLWRAAADSAGP